MARRKKEFYSIKEAAEYLNCHTSWIYQLINLKKLPHTKVGSFHMIPAADLRAYKKNNAKLPKG